MSQILKLQTGMKPLNSRLMQILAEREGFEPSIREHRIHTFQACAFDRSATSPTRAAIIASAGFHADYLPAAIY